MEAKTREDVLAERKLRKAAKQSKKQNSVKQGTDSSKPNAVDISEASERIGSLQLSEGKSNSPAPKEIPKNNTTSQNVPKKYACKKEERLVDITPKSDENACNLANKSQTTEVTKSKAQLKAARRALQEAQRAMKAQKVENVEKNKDEDSNKPKVKAVSVPKTNKKNKETSKKDQVMKSSKDPNIVKMVSHLYLETNPGELDILKKCRSGIHASVMKLGLQYKHKVIIGSNARVVAFLDTLKQVLFDFTCEHNFPREFEIVLECIIQYLRMYRPPSVSMTNAVKFLKWHLTQFSNNIPSSEAHVKLREVIKDYLFKIDKAGEAISGTVRMKICQNDVILTFGYSSLIKRILKESFEKGIQFRVVIVDAGPLYEGKQLLRKLAKKGLPCTYVLLSAVSYVMNEATKVLLGAHALLTNGYVMSRAGSSQVALIAESYNVPVLVCCETHKFSERVQTDALVYNELGDPLPAVKNNQFKSNDYMKSLTLMYDVTPSDLVTAVVTELAILPCTSVPVVLRVKPTNPSVI